MGITLRCFCAALGHFFGRRGGFDPVMKMKSSSTSALDSSLKSLVRSSAVVFILGVLSKNLAEGEPLPWSWFTASSGAGKGSLQAALLFRRFHGLAASGRTAAGDGSASSSPVDFAARNGASAAAISPIASSVPRRSPPDLSRAEAGATAAVGEGSAFRQRYSRCPDQLADGKVKLWSRDFGLAGAAPPGDIENRSTRLCR